MLKGQLHPHFIFNSLHAVSALMHSNVAAADRMLAQIAELLRRSLRSAEVQEVTLREELEFLAPYLEIEQVRLGERLFVEIEVEPELKQALLPHMILQPLVENSVRHGIATRPSGGWLQVSARGSDGRLLLQVMDEKGGLKVVRPGDATIIIYRNEVRLGDVEHLREIPAASIQVMHYHDGSAATYRWGAGHSHGVIQVYTH